MAQYEYTLGAAGERAKVKELDRAVEYTYDALYRLTGEKITAADGTVTEYTYAYDNVSNRILKTENGAETTYTYNALNQLTAETGVTYQYDDAGNLISATSNAKSTFYAYNAENKLIRATVQEGNSVAVEEYEYDYAGNRISKTTTVNGTSETIKYLNDNSVLTNVIAEINDNGEEICYYTIGADLISQERDSAVCVYLYDGHGSVRGLIDSTGMLTDTYNYDAFGNLLDKTGSTVNNYLYCGEQFDAATGLYYLRARYMNPSTGTFITQDTYAGTIFDPTSLHKYLYANANPVMYSDPSGYFGLTDVVCANAIANTLFYGTSAGLINVGLNLIRELRTAEKYGTKIDFGYVITMSFTEGFLTGAFFGCSGMLAASLNSAIIYATLGGTSFLFASLSLAQAQADFDCGDYDLMALDLVFALGGFIGAKNCFDNAVEIASATNTAKTTTIPESENTNTTQNSKPSGQSNGSSNGKNSGRLGNQNTRIQNKQIADELIKNGFEITGGGGYMPEEYLPGPGGARKGSNYIDITATKNGQTYRINTVDVYANGTPTTRELNAATSINGKTPNDPNIILIPKGSGVGNLISILKAMGAI